MLKSVPRLLLLSGVAPGNRGVGRLYLRDLCLLYPEGRIAGVFFERALENNDSRALNWMLRWKIAGPPEFGVNRFGKRVHSWTRPWLERIIESLWIPLAANRAVTLAKAFCPDLLWATLHSPTTYRITQTVAEKLEVPLVTTVWDPPSYKLATDYHPDSESQRRLVAKFDAAVRSSIRCGVASEPMKTQYERTYGTPCVPMVYGMPQQVSHEAATFRLERQEITIGFAGTLYAWREWGVLLGALEDKGWKLAGKPVRLKVLGDSHVRPPGSTAPIELLGWHSVADTIQILADMDIAYLPYWFAPAFREVVRLAFPGKLATYVAARLPILYHGPVDSSPAEFLQRHPVGVACHELNSGSLANCLEELVTDKPAYRRFLDACGEAFNRELSSDVFRNRFAQLVGVPVNALRPTDFIRRASR